MALHPCTEWLSFFAKRRAEARRAYQRFVLDPFGEPLPSPWRNLKFGLVLRGEALQEKVLELVGRKPGKEEANWVANAENPDERRNAVLALAKTAEDRRIQVWIRVLLGGERRVEVATEYGYRDGSAITQIMKRLQARAATDHKLQTQLATIRATFAQQMTTATN